MKGNHKEEDSFSFDSLKDWKEAGQSILDEASKVIKDKTKSLREKPLSEISDDVTTFVKDNPLKSLLIALGVGYILGRLLKRSK